MNPISIVPIQFLLSFAAPSPTKTSWENITLDALDMVKNGMKTIPLLVVNPIHQEIRLDIGNHRVYFLPLLGISKIQCHCLVSDKTIHHPKNGLHKYDAKGRIKPNAKTLLGQYVRVFDAVLPDFSLKMY